MKFSYVSHLYCPKCNEHYDVKEINNLCSCGSPLLVAYNLEQLRRDVPKEELSSRRNDLWRYHELLPVIEEKKYCFHGRRNDSTHTSR